MNKPDWKDAPEWAQYLAQDADGDWYWYEQLPYASFEGWSPDGKHQLAAVFDTWQDTLEGRP